MEAFSLTRLAARLLRWQRAPADPQVELQAAVKRLSELSPHLLIDVGIDPATGEIAEDGQALVLARPVHKAAPVPQEADAPEPVTVRPSRLRLKIRVMPAGQPAASGI